MLQPTRSILSTPFIYLFLSLFLPINAALVIIEAGANAPGTDSENEYIVIHNSGISSEPLLNFTLDDSILGSADTISTASLEAGEFLVVSSGASQADLELAWGEVIPEGTLFEIIPGLDGLNNDSDQIFLFNPDNTLIAQLSYSSATTTGVAQLGGTLTGPAFSSITVPEPSTTLLLSMLLLYAGSRRIPNP